MKNMRIVLRRTALAALMLLSCVIAEAKGEAGGELALVSHVLEANEQLRLSGELSFDAPMYALRCWVRDERTAGTEKEGAIRFVEGALTCGAEEIAAALNDRMGWKKGEKTAFVAADSGNGEAIVFSARFYVLGNPPEAVGAAADCEITIKGGKAYGLSDGRASSDARLNGESVNVVLPPDFGAGTVLIAWTELPEEPEVRLTTREGEIRVEALPAGMYVHHLAIQDDVVSLEIAARNPRASLCDIALFPENEVPPSAQLWEEAREDLDILFISTHQDDEFLFFGGAIPYYAHLGKNIAVAYSVDCGAYRYHEALAALWSAGCRAHPLFLGYEDVDCSTLAQVEYEWARRGGDILTDLVRMIRAYRPKVIVTQDEKGEYGHIHHQYTVAMVEKAVALAADDTFDEESLDALGVWQTLKLYSHLYEQNRIFMDWAQLTVGDGLTAHDLARVAFSHNASQSSFFSMERHGVRYDNTCFGLVYSAVGEDVAKNDFLENIE